MKKLVFILVFGTIINTINAQVSDLQLWTGPVIKYDITKKIRIDFEQQIRFDQNISHYNYTFSEFGLRYEALKYLDLKASFRHSFIPAAQAGSALNDNDRSRVSLDASSGIKIFDTGLKVGYRFRYQNSWEDSGSTSSNYIRNRFGIDYNLSKLVDPYADWENFYRLDNLNEFRQNRYTLGFSWRITKKMGVDSYFRYQKERNVKNPETDFIIGLGFSYTIN